MAKRMTMCGEELLGRLSKEHRADVCGSAVCVGKRSGGHGFVNLNFTNTVSGRWRLRIR